MDLLSFGKLPTTFVQAYEPRYQLEAIMPDGRYVTMPIHALSINTTPLGKTSLVSVTVFGTEELADWAATRSEATDDR